MRNFYVIYAIAAVVIGTMVNYGTTFRAGARSWTGTGGGGYSNTGGGWHK